MKNERWRIERWQHHNNRWEFIATAVDEWYADEIVDSLAAQTGELYRVIPPPIDYGI